MKKEERKHYCNGHYTFKLMAPRGIAYLLEIDKEDEMADKLNVVRFTKTEKNKMKIGTMAFRHFTYETYCQDIPFSYLTTKT